MIPDRTQLAAQYRAIRDEVEYLVGATAGVQNGTLSLNDLASHDRAQVGGMNIVGYFVAILVAGIVGIAVTVPIMEDVINDANLTGTTATIASFIPTLLLVVFVVYVIGPITGG